MSKNAALENLVSELKRLPGVIEDSLVAGESIILARMVKGVSREKWLKASSQSDLQNWYALPVSNAGAAWQENLALDENHFIPVSPFREMAGVITHDMFLAILDQELKRISRNGSNLSVVSCGLVDRKDIKKMWGDTVAGRLEALLAKAMLEHMEKCDSLGILRKGQFLCCMPGIGQLAARSFAEKTQKSFRKQTSSVVHDEKPDMEIECAAGIVNLLQGENYSVSNLIKRSSAALEMAISRSGNHIYQEAAFAPLENTTLVQSSEKRFLFFGE